MSTEVEALIQKLDELIGQLALPLEEDLVRDGWTDESSAGIRSRLEAFRSQVELLKSLPPPAERPLDIVRALDHWGVQGGELVEDLAAFESEMRHAPL